MNAPIGLFDSGVGGISVLQAIEYLLPHQDCLYFGDSVHFPYYEKSPAELIRYASQITAFLLSQQIQLLIIACHTASIHVLPTLQANFPIPIIGMVEPTLLALKKTTKNQRIAILATESTIRSKLYQHAILKQMSDAYLIPLACSKLEQAIEQGEKPSQDLIKECLSPLHNQNIDTVLLACTHYPHILHEIEEELDQETAVLNPALEVAKQAKEKLVEESSPSHAPHHIIYTSGSVETFEKFLQAHPLAASSDVKQVELK